MALEELGNYKNLVVDYSVIREFGGTAVFAQFIDGIVRTSPDVYVSASFKLLHYCVVHQGDSKDDAAQSAMKEFCSLLLPLHKLHSVQTADTVEFLKAVEPIGDCCIVLARDSIFSKRIREKNIRIDKDILVLTATDYCVFHGSEEFINAVPLPEVSKIALKKAYLDSSAFCNVGDKVITGGDKQLELTKRISSGAEGMVFLTDNRLKVAKIYHKNVITPLRWSKLTKMVAMGIKSSGICWPQDLLFYKGVPVGYTMFLGKGKTLGNIFDGPDAMFNNFPEWTREDIAATLINLIEKYLYLHMHNIVAGDIQLKNALLYSSNAVYLIDMDSVQVGNLPCPVGTEEFTDPRLWGRDFAGFVRKLEDEDYSIAMLVFSTLFCGLHPYATRNGAETLREEILEKNFPYFLDDSEEEHIPLGGYNYIWKYLSPTLRTMLYNTFKLGRSYEALQWYEAVLEYKENLAGHKYEDPEAYKMFPKMDYHATVDAEENIPGDRNSVAPGVKKRFNSLAEARQYSSGIHNPFAAAAGSSNPGMSGSAFSRPAGFESPSSGRNSPFVPKAEGNAAKPAAQPEPNQDTKKKRFGLF